MREAQLRLIGMGRQANGLAEDTSEMKRTHIDRSGQFLQVYLLGVVSLQICLRVLDGRVFLPRLMSSQRSPGPLS